ncbi:hypothetical protein OKW34_003994 [Paraburkholderia youngii]
MHKIDTCLLQAVQGPRCHAAWRCYARKCASEPASSGQPALGGGSRAMLRFMFGLRFGGLRSPLIDSPLVNRDLDRCQAKPRRGRDDLGAVVAAATTDGRKGCASRAGSRESRKDAGHLPVQAVESARPVDAEEKIAHGWLPETGASHEERTGPRAPVRPSVEKPRRQTNRNTQRLSRLPER